MNAAGAFKRTLTPYLRRHAERSDDLFGGAWRTREIPLTDERIEGAILGKAILAYFAAYSPRALGIDIDDHAGRGPAVLRAKYDAVRERFGGLSPSLVCLSPRGIHLWYLVPWPMPWEILRAQAEEKLRGLGVELRPTPGLALRIPHESGLVDPETLLPLRRDFVAVVEEAIRYHPAELFNADILPAVLRSDLATRQGRYATIRYSAAIGQAEAELAPIMPGTTNVALCRLVPLYRGAGLSEEETGQRFADLLAPFYDGELRDGGRLRKRIRSFYRHAPDPRPRAVQHGLFTHPMAEAVAKSAVDTLTARLPTGRRRALRRSQVQRSFRRLAAGILAWDDFVAAVRADPRELALWNYLYPYFVKNTREGYCPLPRSVLRRIDINYSRHLADLVACGFLSPSPYPYAPGAGIARYYRIDRERFGAG
jgi:hypothetical protein